MEFSHALREISASIIKESLQLGFDMICDVDVANLCTTLVASKQSSKLLELGTGTGLSTAYILAGAGSDAQLDSVDINQAFTAIAQKYLRADKRVVFHTQDAGAFLERAGAGEYDFIFADAWPGKYSHLQYSLNVLKKGGIYLVDDMLPQSNWPDGHQKRVDAFLAFFRRLNGYAMNYMNWASGVAVITKMTDEEFERPSYSYTEEFEFLFSTNSPQSSF